MDSIQRFLIGLRLIAMRHSLRVWLLWAVVAVVIALTPFALLDPAGWMFLLDPELAAIAALIGIAGLRQRVTRRISFVKRN
jgi:hypothetical protein